MAMSDANNESNSAKFNSELLVNIRIQLIEEDSFECPII